MADNLSAPVNASEVVSGLSIPVNASDVVDDLSASDKTSAMTNESVADIPMTIEQLRMQDSGPDLSKEW